MEQVAHKNAWDFAKTFSIRKLESCQGQNILQPFCLCGYYRQHMNLKIMYFYTVPWFDEAFRSCFCCIVFLGGCKRFICWCEETALRNLLVVVWVRLIKNFDLRWSLFMLMRIHEMLIICEGIYNVSFLVHGCRLYTWNADNLEKASTIYHL